jgi:molybdopterin-guanine dinucleotide biosynthesis adapter protein
MALVKPIIFQVAGYQNSGKTTFTLKVIQGLRAAGIAVATIKHHGHGGKPEVQENKDSLKHLSAGASASIVEGCGRMILQAEGTDIGLQDQIELLSFFEPDVILVEGYKHQPFPKVVLMRIEADLPLLSELTNIKAIVYWQDDLRENIAAQMDVDVPRFHINDGNSVEWTVELLRNCVEERG